MLVGCEDGLMEGCEEGKLDGRLVGESEIQNEKLAALETFRPLAVLTVTFPERKSCGNIHVISEWLILWHCGL
jgi:hypothetical protein